MGTGAPDVVADSGFAPARSPTARAPAQAVTGLPRLEPRLEATSEFDSTFDTRTALGADPGTREPVALCAPRVCLSVCLSVCRKTGVVKLLLMWPPPLPMPLLGRSVDLFFPSVNPFMASAGVKGKVEGLRREGGEGKRLKREEWRAGGV